LGKYIKFLVLCALAAFVLIWFGRNLNWAEVSGAMRRADWRMVAVGVVLVWATYLIRGFRWRALLKPLAPRASLREAFAATTVGFAAIFLVGRAVGEVLRPAFLSLRDPEVKPGPAFVTIAVERIYDMVAIVVLFAANLLVYRPPAIDAAGFARLRLAGLLLLGVAVVAISALAVFRLYATPIVRGLERRVERLPKALRRVSRVFTGLLEQLGRTLGVLVDTKELLVTVGWTAMLWAAITLANLLVLRAFGLDVGLGGAVFVLGWSLVGSLVPTPGGGAGTYHAATAAGMLFAGIARTQDEAAAVVIVLNLVVFGSAIFFGPYYFLRGGVSLSRLRGLAASQEKEGVRGGEPITGEA
jgi:uncharacterized protein (TIRG00374 family)